MVLILACFCVSMRHLLIVSDLLDTCTWLRALNHLANWSFCPQARVLTNLEHLNVEETEEDTGSAVPMPELQHNMKLLVDMTEAEIRRLDTSLRQKEDTAVCAPRPHLWANAARDLMPRLIVFEPSQTVFLVVSIDAGYAWP